MKCVYYFQISIYRLWEANEAGPAEDIAWIRKLFINFE